MQRRRQSTQSVNGQPFWAARFFVLLFCLLFAGQGSADRTDLADVRLLEKAGAFELALTTLDALEPGSGQHQKWADWARQRLNLLYRLKDWPAVLTFADKLPVDADPDLKRETQTHVVRALINLNRSADARRMLRRLLFDAGASDSERRIWRQWVIQSYLIDNDIADAQVALRRYNLEFTATDPDWLLLQARVYLQAGQPDGVPRLLAGLQIPDARELTWLARILSNDRVDQRLLKALKKHAQDKKATLVSRYRGWVLYAKAASVRGDHERQVYGLEQALNIEAPGKDILFDAGPDDLRDAYLALAEKMGNDQGLLIGDTRAWQRLAETTLKTPVKHRAILAFLSDGDLAGRNPYVVSLVDSLITADLGFTAYKLLTGFGWFDELSMTPATTRFKLGKWMAGQDRMDLADRLFAGIEQAPQGIANRDWQLTRARVALYGGDAAMADHLLGLALSSGEPADDAFIDRALQVVFDLQSIQQHEQALRHLEKLFALSVSMRQRREILFWQADSEVSLGRHARAAALYLKSAYYRKSDSGDLWGQSALFKAAEQAAKAGKPRDAEVLYHRLLSLTSDKTRKALLISRIQQLWLLKKTPTTP